MFRHPGDRNIQQIAQMKELQKALLSGDTTGLQVANLTGQSGSPITKEFLNRLYKILTFEKEHFTQINTVNRVPMKSSIHQFVQGTSLGSGGGRFGSRTTPEGGAPLASTSQSERRFAIAKTYGSRRGVSFVLDRTDVVDSLETAMALERKNGLLDVMQQTEIDFAWGETTLIPTAMSGAYAQHILNSKYRGGSSANSVDYFGYINDNTFVIDMGGQSLTDSILEDAATAVFRHAGRPNAIYGAPRTISKYVKGFLSQKLINPNSPQVTDGVMGQRVKQAATQYGDLDIRSCVFLENQAFSETDGVAIVSVVDARNYTYDGVNGRILINSDPNVATSDDVAVAVPNVTAGGVTPLASPVAQSRWGQHNSGGNYYFAVMAVGTGFHSDLTVLNPGGAATIPNGGAADLAFTQGTPTNPTYPSTGYLIFRSEPVTTQTPDQCRYYPIFTVSEADPLHPGGTRSTGYCGAAAGSVRDLDFFMPGMEQAYVLEHTPRTIEFGELWAPSEIDFALIQLINQFFVFTVATPLLYSPQFMVRLINCNPS